MNVLILQGGNSPEREVSLRSANAVIRAVKQLGHHVETYDPQDGLDGMLSVLARANVVIPVLHGTGGEDGSVQAFLDSSRVPYVGAEAEVSKRCFDKVATKKVLEKNGLPTPKWAEVDPDSFTASPLAQQPYVLKPILGGSSIDTFIVRNPGGQSVDMSVFERYETMLLEELITGTELTVGMLGTEALPVIEILPPEGKEFDYSNKYNGETQELCPPKHVDKAAQEVAQDLAEQAHQFLGVRHYSRTDIMLSSSGEQFILELNTIPGLTDQSLYPKAAAHAGLSMPQLMERLIGMAVHGK